MANFFYLPHIVDLATKLVDYATDTLKAIPVSSSTTADTEKNKATIDAFTTLAELDAKNQRKTWANPSVAIDVVNERVEVDADDFVWTAVSFGTIQALVNYQSLGGDNDASSVPAFYIDSGFQGLITNGGDVTVQVNAEGLLQLPSAPV